MRSGILVILFVLAMLFVYREAQAIRPQIALFQCEEKSSSEVGCLANENTTKLTKLTGLVDSVTCLEDNSDFQSFQIHLIPRNEVPGKLKLPQTIHFTVKKQDSQNNYQKTVYFIKGETPTLWLKRNESTWKIAQVEWQDKDLPAHKQGPPRCKL